MSAEFKLPDQPRLLPEAMENTVQTWAIRTAGLTLVAFSVTCWLGLLTWRAAAPGEPVRFILGPFGSAASDFLLQTLGIAAVVALAGPMIWGLELLITMRPINGIRRNLMVFSVGVLTLAGALSGLPTIAAWPLHNGFGGMLGDIIYNLAAMVGNAVNPERGHLIAGVLLAFSGVSLTAISLGFQTAHFLRARSNPAATAQPANLDDDSDETLPSRPGLGMRMAGLASTLWSRARAHRDVTADSADPYAADSDLPDHDFDDDIEPAPTRRAARTTAGRSRKQTPAASPSESINAGSAPSNAAADEMAPASEAAEQAGARAFAARFAPTVTGERPAPGETAPTQRLLPLIKATLAIASGRQTWRRPSLDLLRRPQPTRIAAVNAPSLAALGRTLQEALADFGVAGTIVDACPGPVVTRFEFEPVRGTKTARIIALADDIARSLSVHTVRVAVIQGRSTIGIEVPNQMRHPVLLREVIDTDMFRQTKATLPLALGRGIGGEVVVADLARMPHLLIAGTTGSGKSVGINAMILSLLYSMDPSECRLLMIDPKMLELAPYNGIPHLAGPVVTDPNDAADALEWAVGEMESRYQRMAKLGVRNIEAFNKRVRYNDATGRGLVRTVQTGYDPDTGRPIFEHETLEAEPMPYIVIVVDEFADLMMTAGERVETAVQRLSQMARAAGIHMIMATQRPTVDIVTGTIKSNFPMRLSFRVASKIDSRTILGETGAEQLLGQGDMLLSCGNGQMFRVHGAYVSDEEIEGVAQHLRDNAASAAPALSHASKAPSLPHHETMPNAAAPHDEDQYAAAVAVVATDRKVSPGHLHRRLGIGEIAASAYIDRMQDEGLVGPANAFGRRRIMMKPSPNDVRNVA